MTRRPRRFSPPTGASPYSVSIQHLDGDWVVAFRGELDITAIDELWSCIEEVRDCGGPLTIDLAETTFIDSSGVNVLIKAYRARGQRAEGVILRWPSEAVKQIMALTGLTDVFQIEQRAAQPSASTPHTAPDSAHARGSGPVDPRA